jgi:RimJ/RimL family protein N-acetyltransferase
VREGNSAAIALYQAVGFQLEGVQRRACLVDGTYFNHLMMAVLFDN